MRIHTREKPYECLACGMMFLRKIGVMHTCELTLVRSRLNVPPVWHRMWVIKELYIYRQIANLQVHKRTLTGENINLYSGPLWRPRFLCPWRILGASWRSRLPLSCRVWRDSVSSYNLVVLCHSRRWMLSGQSDNSSLICWAVSRTFS